jgi:hypothetical protein
MNTITASAAADAVMSTTIMSTMDTGSTAMSIITTITITRT